MNHEKEIIIISIKIYTRRQKNLYQFLSARCYRVMVPKMKLLEIVVHHYESCEGINNNIYKNIHKKTENLYQFLSARCYRVMVPKMKLLEIVVHHYESCEGINNNIYKKYNTRRQKILYQCFYTWIAIYSCKRDFECKALQGNGAKDEIARNCSASLWIMWRKLIIISIKICTRRQKINISAFTLEELFTAIKGILIV